MIQEVKNPKGWVLFDGQCRFCIGWANRFGAWLHQNGYGLAPLQTKWVQDRLQMPSEHLLDEMRVITETNHILGGADAVLYLLRSTWYTWPLYAISFIPGIKPILRSVYRYVAARRNCLNGACKIEEHSHDRRIFSQAWLGWLPLFVLPALAIAFQTHMSAWVFMWTISFAIFSGFKWLSFWQALQHFPDCDKFRLALFWLWPGMDADSFANYKSNPVKPKALAWSFAAMKVVLGGFLFWGVARTLPLEWQLARGWVGLVGLAFILHFGSFQFLAFFWQYLGIDVTPVMMAPVISKSLTEFWSHRWNLAFRQLANRIAFQPLHKRLGPMGAMSIVFLGSGLIHELAISLPAQGGYGLPTLYFMLQACGMTFERSFIGKKIGLGSGGLGWVFTMLITAGPAFWLFHPPFVRNVVIPFMEAMHAL